MVAVVTIGIIGFLLDRVMFAFQAAFTFTSIAILDALKMFPGPIVELHISNIHRREDIYHRSLVSKIATAVIAGLGPQGYPTAIRALKGHIEAGRRGIP